MTLSCHKQVYDCHKPNPDCGQPHYHLGHRGAQSLNAYYIIEDVIHMIHTILIILIIMSILRSLFTHQLIVICKTLENCPLSNSEIPVFFSNNGLECWVIVYSCALRSAIVADKNTFSVLFKMSVHKHSLLRITNVVVVVVVVVVEPKRRYNIYQLPNKRCYYTITE